MRYFVLALALIFSLGNMSQPSESSADAAIQTLVDKGQEREAFTLAKEAALAGDAKAHEWLGWFFDQGRGVDANLDQAVHHYRIAIGAGHNYARWRVGVLIDEGRTSGTLESAVALFEQAAEEGFTNAMVSMAVMQATGRGTAQDFEGSLANYMRAAQAGNTQGMKGVGVLFALGQGVPQDSTEAGAWFMLAAVLGNEEGAMNLELMAESATDAQMEQMTARAGVLGEELGFEVDLRYDPDL